MSQKPTEGKPLTLRLVDEPDASGAAEKPSEAPAQGARPGRDLRITTSDEFLAAAAKEYEKGQVDPALWARSAAQSGGDESLAIAAYLRARATALQLERRRQRSDKPVRAAGESKPLERGIASGSKETGPRAEAPRSRIDRRLVYGGGPIAALIVMLVAWLLLSTRQADTQPTLAAASSAAAPPRAAAPPAAAPVAAPPADPPFEVKVAELQKAGNWNVLVLYAVEWTRKEPGNAAAWNALSVGYANLRQRDEALDAANKAVALAPSDAGYLRNLGRANLAVDRLPEAGAAFDRVLAVAADDVDALCGAAEVASRQSRPKDADAFARRVATANAQCQPPAERPAFAPATGRAAR